MKQYAYWKYKNIWHRILGIKTCHFSYFSATHYVWVTGLFGRGGKWHSIIEIEKNK